MHFAHCICKEDMQPRVSTQKHQWQKACWASEEENVTTDHLYLSLHNKWADATILPCVSPSSLTFFSRSRLAKPARTVAARSWGPRRSSSSPSCRTAVTSARRVRTTQTRTTTRTSSWWWKKWLRARRCAKSSLQSVYYHEAGEDFVITINLSPGRRIKCIDSQRSGEWVSLRYVSCPEVSSI